MGIDVAGVLFAVRPDGGIPPFPELLIDLGDTARASLAPLALVGLKCAGGGFPGCHSTFYRWISFADTLVDFHCRRPAHLVGDVGVDVQCGAAGHMPDDGREGFDVHSMFQGKGRKCVSKVMESDLFAPGSL